jgi:hypothetical protein
MISGNLNGFLAVSLQRNDIPPANNRLTLHCYLCEEMDVIGGDDHVGFDNLLIYMTGEFQSVVRHRQSP